jgi:hypothetical protein
MSWPPELWKVVSLHPERLSGQGEVFTDGSKHLQKPPPARAGVPAIHCRHQAGPSSFPAKHAFESTAGMDIVLASAIVD